jgi:hypothetical protein
MRRANNLSPGGAAWRRAHSCGSAGAVSGALMCWRAGGWRDTQARMSDAVVYHCDDTGKACHKGRRCRRDLGVRMHEVVHLHPTAMAGSKQTGQVPGGAGMIRGDTSPVP